MTHLTRSRWVQLALMVLCTVMLGNMQYGWTLFVNPMRQATHWQVASIQLAFTIMILLNTWLAPIEGWVVDRRGPRMVVMFGGLMAALCWVMYSRAQSLSTLYAAGAIGGIALGCVFGTCMGSALKWFPDRRGFAAGMIAAGYSLGPAFMVIPLAGMIHSSGYRQTFLVFGLIQGLSILLLGMLLLKPVVPQIRSASRAILQGAEFSPVQTLRTGVFWVIYLVYVLIGFGGMVLTAQLGPLAKDLGVDLRPVAMLGFSMPALTLAVTVDNFANGITRPLCGFLSDRIGRENAMLLLFGSEALAFVGLAAFGHSAVAFVISAAFVFLFWGEIFAVFPAICGDTFGVRNATANNGLLYTAKGTSALAVPLASLLVSATGTWTSMLLAAAAASLLAGLLAKFVVIPMRRRLVGSLASQARAAVTVAGQ
jgi:MFS transporter, OFA family, oxalate/formate antiporter